MIATSKPDRACGFHRLKSLRVVGGFLDNVSFDFAQGLNCLIGARGTGKTTALELVRYAMDGLPPRDHSASERKRIESLIEGNLAGGRVEVTLETKDGLTYTVIRSAGEEPIVLGPDREPTPITFKSGGLFTADIYSQNQVETIADRSASQLDLIDNFEADRIAEIQAEIRRVVDDLELNADHLIPLQRQIATLQEQLHTLPAVEEKLKKFADANNGGTAEVNQAHALKSQRDREGRIFKGALTMLREVYAEVSSVQGRIGQDAKALDDADVAAGPNGTIVQQMFQCLADADTAVNHLIVTACERLTEQGNKVSALGDQLEQQHKQQELAFRAVIEC